MSIMRKNPGEKLFGGDGLFIRNFYWNMYDIIT